MLDSLPRILRAATLVLAVLLLGQLARISLRSNPLAGITIPKVPTLADDKSATNATANPTAGSGVTPQAKPVASLQTTHSASTSNAANTLAGTHTASTHSNTPTPAQTNLVLAKVASTNTATNPIPLTETNARAGSTTHTASTSSNAAPTAAKPAVHPGPPPGFPGGPMMGRGRGAGGPPSMTHFPPVVQARLDKVVQSEILGPVSRPLPMALLGVAGDQALLRTATGQTGFFKEGAMLGEVKLLKVGTNRVLIEHEKQTKELTIFSGFGSESLMPKKTETLP